MTRLLSILLLLAGCATPPQPGPPMPPRAPAMSHRIDAVPSASVPRQVLASWNECGPLPADCFYRIFTCETVDGWSVTIHDTRETSVSLWVTNTLFATVGLVLPDGTVLMGGKECP